MWEQGHNKTEIATELNVSVIVERSLQTQTPTNLAHDIFEKYISIFLIEKLMNWLLVVSYSFLTFW